MRVRSLALLRAVAMGLLLTVSFSGCHGKRETSAVSTPEPPAATLTDVYLTDDKDNAVAKSTFMPDSKPIYLMYAADHVKNVPIRAVWMANSPSGGSKAVLEEQEITAANDKETGNFAERPPMSGWALGPYQVDIYFGPTLVHSEHFMVARQAMAMNPESTDDANVVATASPALPTSGVLKPNVTPIPDTPVPVRTVLIPRDLVPEDAEGRVIMGINDKYMLHVSRLCYNVAFTVMVNGRRQGVYAVPDVTSNISLDFAPGPNHIRISWDAPIADRDCQMAIQLRRGTRLSTLTQIHVFRLSPPRGIIGLGVVVQ